MAVRRASTSGRSTTRNTRSSKAAAPAPARRKAAPAPAPKPAAARRDVTEYAEKPPTPYHKAFAQWIVKEVGYDPNSAPNLRAAFLKGVSIATAARPSFNESDFIEEWRERTGETKRGPKPTAEKEAAAPVRKGRRKPEPEPVEEDDDEFDEDDDEFEEDDDTDSDDDDFDDDDDSDEDDSDDDDDDEFDDEDDEPAPAPKRGRPAKKAAPAASARGRAASGARKAAPAKAARSGSRASKGAADDDDFLF